MIHVLNNLFEEYGMILDGLKNCLMSNGPDIFSFEMICEKLGTKKLKRKLKKKGIIKLGAQSAKNLVIN